MHEFIVPLTLFCLLALAFVRNEITLRVRLMRIEHIYHTNLKRIEDGTWTSDDRLRYEQMPTYDFMLLDVRKWTYRQFFPEAA